MKGLFIKDCCLIRNQMKLFIVVIFAAIAMTWIGYDYTFITSYLTFLCSVLVLSTISYDEFDHGYAFLFTLPFKRKTYVKEKYLFGLLISLAAWLLGLMITAVFQMAVQTSGFSLTDLFVEQLILLPALCILLSVMLPFQLKFGGEKGRIAIFGAVGIAVVLGVILVKACAFLNIDIDALLNTLPALSVGAMTVLSLLAAMMILLLSEKISESIISKKEF